MTDTFFGSGRYTSTLAAVPTAPILEQRTSESINLTIGPDTNPAHTLYAIYNETDGIWLDHDGIPALEPSWQTRAFWGTLTIQGLVPCTLYTFHCIARNQDGFVTAPGPSSSVITLNAGTAELAFDLEVIKGSSTILSPSFMRGLEPGIRIAGKDLHELGFMIDTIGGLDMPGVVSDDELVPGDHTWRIWNDYFSPRRIVLKGHLHASSPDDLRMRLAYLKSFFATFEGDPWRSRNPVRLERNDMPGRYWNVCYERMDQAEFMGRRETASSARISITLKCPVPFAIAGDATRLRFESAAGSFHPIELGNAPSDAVYVFHGPTENPAITVGDMIFRCDFENGLAFTGIENTITTGICDPPEGAAAALRTTITGTGMLISAGATVAFNCPGNRTDGSWIVVIEPQWTSSTRDIDAVIFEHAAPGGDSIRLAWNSIYHNWLFMKRAGGIDHIVSSPPQAFTTHTRIILGLVYDHTNAGGMKLFVNGVQAGIGTDTSVLESAPGTLTLHSADGGGQADVIVDFVAGWSRMLSSDEMLKIATDPTACRNGNIRFECPVMLDTGDTLTLDSRLKTATLFDVSAGSRTNVLASPAGTIPSLVPGRRRNASDRTQTMLYTKNAASELEIRYSRRYL
jgi:hypothetical protein